MKPDSEFIRDLWHTIDKDYAIGAPGQASTRIIGERLAAVTNSRSGYKTKCQAQIAEEKKEGLNPIVKNGLIKRWTKILDGETSGDY